MAGLTPTTNALNSGSYLPVAEFLKRCDQRSVGDLCSDTGTRVTSSSLTSDPNLAAALLDASGMLEAALTAGQRYAPADIANMVALTGAAAPAAVPNAGQGLIYRLLTDLTQALLWKRRPDKGPVPEHLLWVFGYLDRFADGERVLPFLETQKAGLAEDQIEQPSDVENRNLSSVQAWPLFGRRGNRITQAGTQPGPNSSGWPWGP